MVIKIQSLPKVVVLERNLWLSMYGDPIAADIGTKSDRVLTYKLQSHLLKIKPAEVKPPPEFFPHGTCNAHLKMSLP